MAQAVVTTLSPADIQAALDANPPGGTVHLPAGRIELRAPLRLGSDTTLAGAGTDATVLVLAPGSNTHVLVNRGAGDHDIAVRDLTIDGNRPQQDPPPSGRLAWAFGLWFRSVRGVQIDRVAVRQVRQNGIQLNQCRQVRISDVVTHDMGWSGIATTCTDDLVLRRVAVHRAGLDTVHSGIHLDGVVVGHVDGLAEDCSGNALMLDSVSGPVRSVTVRATGRRSRQGIALIASAHHPVENVHVTGHFEHNEENGIFISNADGISVLAATVRGNGRAGVMLQGQRGCHRCVVADCRISGSPRSVVETHGSDDNLVTGTRGAPRRLVDRVRSGIHRARRVAARGAVAVRRSGREVRKGP